MTNLDNLITRANNVLGALEGLIEGDAAETPIVDASVLYPFPAIAFDEANDAWTLTQNTADSGDGLYKGVYRLALETGCAVLTVVNHNVTTPGDGIPARYQACGAGSFTDVTSMTTLNNKQIDKLEIRSATPFEVKVKLAVGWCYEWDFSLGDGGFVSRNWPWPNGTTWGGVYVPGSYWHAGGYTNTMIMKQVPQTATISAVTVWFSGGTNTGILKVGDLATNAGSVNLLDGLSNGIRQSFTPVQLSSGVYFGAYTIGSGIISKVRLEGTGINPFGSNSC